MLSNYHSFFSSWHWKDHTGVSVLDILWSTVVIDVIRSTIIEDLIGMKDSKMAVVFYYCQHNDQKKYESMVLLHTLIYQLSKQIPPNLDYFPSIDAVSMELFQAIITSLVKKVFHTIYIVVDGLNELDIGTRINAAPD
jgi:hypothetical protein